MLELFGDEVMRKVATIELHAFDPLLFGLQALAFIDRDHAVFANFVHRVSQQLRSRDRCWRRSKRRWPSLLCS